MSPTRSRSRWLGCLAGAGVVGMPILLWIGCEVYHAKTSNPGTATTCREYRETMPAPEWAIRVAKGGKPHHLVGGPIRAPLALPSGPPVYVFDAGGMLIDWTLDEGDDEAFQGRWSGLPSGSFDVKELDRIFGHVPDLLQTSEDGATSDEPK